nr:hypothetical protein [Tanacetum cinerariifolium]
GGGALGRYAGNGSESAAIEAALHFEVGTVFFRSRSPGHLHRTASLARRAKAGESYRQRIGNRTGVGARQDEVAEIRERARSQRRVGVSRAVEVAPAGTIALGHHEGSEAGVGYGVVGTKA